MPTNAPDIYVYEGEEIPYWNPSDSEYARYKARELELAEQNLKLVVCTTVLDFKSMKYSRARLTARNYTLHSETTLDKVLKKIRRD